MGSRSIHLDGRWSTPNTTMGRVWGNYCPDQPRVIFVSRHHFSEISGKTQSKLGHMAMSQYAAIKNYTHGDFPGGPVVRTLRFHCQGPACDPWSGN